MIRRLKAIISKHVEETKKEMARRQWRRKNKNKKRTSAKINETILRESTLNGFLSFLFCLGHRRSVLRAVVDTKKIWRQA